jgi:hypothetical protein
MLGASSPTWHLAGLVITHNKYTYYTAHPKNTIATKYKTTAKL